MHAKRTPLPAPVCQDGTQLDRHPLHNSKPACRKKDYKKALCMHEKGQVQRKPAHTVMADAEGHGHSGHQHVRPHVLLAGRRQNLQDTLQLLQSVARRIWSAKDWPQLFVTNRPLWTCR